MISEGDLEFKMSSNDHRNDATYIEVVRCAKKLNLDFNQRVKSVIIRFVKSSNDVNIYMRQDEIRVNLKPWMSSYYEKVPKNLYYTRPGLKNEEGIINPTPFVKMKDIEAFLASLKKLTNSSENASLNDINTEKAPALVINSEDIPIIVCPNCDNGFKKAPRCPECGQKIKYDNLTAKKEKIKSLDEWNAKTHIQGAKPEDITGVVKAICIDNTYSYHLGTVDLSLDLCVGGDRVPLFMFFGNKDRFGFQPSSLVEFVINHGYSADIIKIFLEELREFLSSKQKNVPYERLNGYYYIDYSTLVTKSEVVKERLMKLARRLSCN